MPLTEKPELVIWPQMHFVFVERTGPFQNAAPQAWQAIRGLESAVSEHNQITGRMSLYKTGPQIYRAGFSLTAAPVDLPRDLQHEHLDGGKYSRFVLTGSYMQLPQASGRVWQIVAEEQIPLRDDFAIESYPNNPATTPEEQWITDILIPTA